MTDAEIEWLKSSIAAKTPLAWRDIDGGMHTVLGYIAEYKESWEEIAEPVVALPGNKVAALRNTEAECFYVMTPALDAAPASDAEPWHPIKTAPKDNSPMLLCCVDWAPSALHGKPIPIKVGGWDVEYGRWHIFGASWAPTHWMPLPNPPMTIDT